MEPTRCVTVCNSAHPTWPVCNNAVASAENVEKVVSPPRKPVMTNNRTSGGSPVLRDRYSTAMPIRYPPIRFAAKVPSGSVGTFGLKPMPSIQRNQAPSAAPIPTARNPKAVTLLSREALGGDYRRRLRSRTYLTIAHARVCVKTGVQCCTGRICEVTQLRQQPVLMQTRKDGPIWAHFVAVARLVYVTQ